MEYIERTVSWLTKNVRAHDAKLLTKQPSFTSHPIPTLTVKSPSCGPSSSKFDIDHTQDGKNLLPALTWTLPSSIPSESVKEYLLLVEDADGPLGFPIMHAGYYHIPATKTSIGPEDIEKQDGKKGNVLKGGFKYAKNLRGTVYSRPKPLKGHGEHRRFYEVVALSESIGEDGKGLSVPAKNDELVKGLEGKILGWGQWIGVAERN